MKKLILTLILATPAVAHAGKFDNLEVFPSSAARHVGFAQGDGSLRPGLVAGDRVFTSSGAAVVQSTSATSGYKPFRVFSNALSELLSVTQSGIVTAATFVGNLTGNVTGNVSGTAAALAANGANCTAGQYPLGVDAAGAVESCTAAGIGDSVKTSSETQSGTRTFTSVVTVGPTGSLVVNANAVINSSVSIPGYATGIFNAYSSSHPVGTSSVSFTLDGVHTVKISFNLQQLTADGFFLGRFNHEAAGHDSFVIRSQPGSGPTLADDDGTATYCGFQSAAVSGTDAGAEVTGEVTISVSKVDSTIANLNGWSKWKDGNGSHYFATIHCRYDGAAAVSSFALYTSAGSFAGDIIAQKLGRAP